MMQTELTKRAVAQIGEAIPHELGASMVNDYRHANPTDVVGYQIGRTIIEEILAQPDCAGIRFFNAYNEKGEKTLVYLGVDSQGHSIIERSTVVKDGSIKTEKAIIADRSRIPGTQTEETGWDWFIETI